MIIAVDLDGTLCSWHAGAYELARPFPEKIDRIQRLHSAGYEIWIYTARGGSLGSEEAAFARWGEMTLGQLSAWGVPFHRLIIGKPPFDALIDDRAVTFTEDWEAQLARNKAAREAREQSMP